MLHRWVRIGSLLLLSGPLVCLAATTQTVRIASFNTQGDVGGSDSGPDPATVIPQLATVIEGIGQQQYTGDNVLRLADIIALQETTSYAVTIAPLLSALNTAYGSAVYSFGAVGTQSGGNTFGNGPNAVIYNQTTLRLLESKGVGTPLGSANGEYRQVMRYEFQPLVATGANSVFYIYTSHMKSGDGSTPVGSTTVAALRGQEAAIIRNDAAALPAGTSILYTGDLNTADTTEAMYQTFIATNSPSGVARGQAVDPLNPTNATINFDSSAHVSALTENSDALRYRDDYILMSTNVYAAAAGALDYIPNSYHGFGNNGGTSYLGSVNLASNHALDDIAGHPFSPTLTLTPAQVLAAMNPDTGSDHLPVVADFTIIVPEPSGVMLACCCVALVRRGRRRASHQQG